MDKIKKFIEYLNDKTLNKYTYLKLKDIFYDLASNLCKVEFIYPSQIDLNDDNRREIYDAIKSYIKLDVVLKVEINKSFLESDLIVKQIKNFFETSHKFFFSSFNFENMNVTLGDVVKIVFKLESKLESFFTQFNIDKTLISYLDKNFCAMFEITHTESEETATDDDMLNSRIKNIERQNDFDSLLSVSQDKYFVTDKKPLIGDEITFNPRFIRTIKMPIESTVVAGKIESLTERTFKKKTKKVDKDGQVIVEDRPYFSLSIRDDTGIIGGVIFTTKSQYHKMHLLNIGDMIAVQGRVTKFNERFEIMAQKISYCTLPNRQEVEVVDQNLTTDYRYVRPQKYTIQRQASLFEEKHLSNEVLNGTFVVYDFETTGLDCNKEEIIEIGALKIVNGEYMEVFTTLVKPTKHIPEEATKVNKITDEMVASCYKIEQVIRDFYLFCKGATLVGYNNLFFDKLFLDKAGAKVGINFDNPQLDAFSLARQKITFLRHYNLSSVAKYLDVTLTDAHRALSDVLATAEVFLKLY